MYDKGNNVAWNISTNFYILHLAFYILKLVWRGESATIVDFKREIYFLVYRKHIRSTYR